MLVLASQSPRRAQLLNQMEVPFRRLTAAIDEDALLHRLLAADERPDGSTIVCELAAAKARHITDRLHREGQTEVRVLAADTIVMLDDELLGKPHSPEEAYATLRKLCGRTHQVYTGVALSSATDERIFADRSDVTFRPWSDRTEQLVARYVASGSPLDKAGAYGIQDQGGLLISHLSGDFYSVMGLPISRVYAALQELNWI